jgi:hypothetical protein
MVNLALAMDKYSTGTRSNDLLKPAAAGETVVTINSVHCYFTNSTITKATGTEEQTFLIGHDDHVEPSMMWLESGYAGNDYLYFGMCRMAANGDEIRFSTLTSEDWSVVRNDPNAISPYEISFSMDDRLAGAQSQGVWAKETVHAWSESYRDDFYILEYDIANTSATAYTDFYVWLHMDADISLVAGGADNLAYYRDDFPSYYTGTDINGNPEFISYMFDADNPNISGDDTGGKLSPKESLGYIGSRVLDCPPRVGEGPESANTQSGHQWWDWNSDPDTGGDFYNLCIKQEFKADPGSPHDYRYMQITGPFTIEPGDTIHVAFGFGIGEGQEGLRANLQWAYDLYWNDFRGPAAPTAPTAMIESGDGWLSITWDDTTSENSADPLTGEVDFQGYRLYRSPDRTNWTLLVDYDIVDDQGENTGLPPKNKDGLYEFIDEDVTNGFFYYYTVAAYDKGTGDLSSLETGKTVDLYAMPGPPPTGNTINENKIRVVPNPFVVKAPWDMEPTVDNPAEERIQFQNVPNGAKVTIFNLAGDMIIELVQQGEQGFVDWDLITRNRQKAVSGLYMYAVEPPEGDNFIGKFVIVR